MTKVIRVENADTSNHKVRVVTQYKNTEGIWTDSSEIKELNNPTALSEFTIWDAKRIIVEEYI
jgi:hypothetical protein